MVGTIVHQLTRNLNEQQIKDAGFDAYFVDHTAGVYPQAASGTPWSAGTISVTGDTIADLTEDLAADAAMVEGQHEKSRGSLKWTPRTLSLLYQGIQAAVFQEGICIPDRTGDLFLVYSVRFGLVRGLADHLDLAHLVLQVNQENYFYCIKSKTINAIIVLKYNHDDRYLPRGSTKLFLVSDIAY